MQKLGYLIPKKYKNEFIKHNKNKDLPETWKEVKGTIISLPKSKITKLMKNIS